MRAHIHITLYRTTFQSYTKTWSTSIDKCFKPLKNKQIILPKQDARGLFRNSTTPSPSQRLWNDLPKKAFGGGPCPCPKRWGGDKPIVRYDLFLTKALKLGMGEVKNCPQTRTQNPTARMYLAIPKPCDGEATLNQNRSCNATENQRIILFLGSKRFHKTAVGLFGFWRFTKRSWRCFHSWFIWFGHNLHCQSVLLVDWKVQKLKVSTVSRFISEMKIHQASSLLVYKTEMRYWRGVEVYARQMQVQIPNHDTLHDRNI